MSGYVKVRVVLFYIQTAEKSKDFHKILLKIYKVFRMIKIEILIKTQDRVILTRDDTK